MSDYVNSSSLPCKGPSPPLCRRGSEKELHLFKRPRLQIFYSVFITALIGFPQCVHRVVMVALPIVFIGS